MFTPQVVRHRKALREAVRCAFPDTEPDSVFEAVKKEGAPVIELFDLEPYCRTANCPAAVIEDIFAPYGAKGMVITKAQWETFLNDDFPVYVTKDDRLDVDEKQRFLLFKFTSGLLGKFGGTVSSLWSVALARNPPNTLTTVLKLSALCRLFEHMNLPFTVGDFVDALFAFYGEQTEGITFVQFGALFTAFS